MKKSALFIVMMVLVLIVAACSGGNNSAGTSSNSGGTSGGSSTNTGSSGDSSDFKITLRSSTHSAQSEVFTKAYDAFLDEIEKRTDGRVTFERYYTQTLAPLEDLVGTIKDGVADIGVVITPAQMGKLSLSEVGNLPGIPRSPWVGIKAINELYTHFSELDQQFEDAGVVRVGAFMNSPFYIASTKKLGAWDDLKGQRILILGEASMLAEKLGMTPINMSYAEAYEAVTRNTVDAIAFDYNGVHSNGLQNDIKYYWELPVDSAFGVYAMSKEVWDKLPKDIQDIIIQVREEFQPDSYHQIYHVDGDIVNKEEMVAKNGLTVVPASEADIDYLMSTARETSWASWLKRVSDAGLPGQEVLNKYIELVDKYTEEAKKLNKN